VNRKQ